MLGQRLRRWPNIEPTLNKCTMFERKSSCSPANTRHLYNIYTTSAQRFRRIFSIIMEYGLGLPTGTIAFWGTLVPRILTVDHTFKLTVETLDHAIRLEVVARCAISDYPELVAQIIPQFLFEPFRLEYPLTVWLPANVWSGRVGQVSRYLKPSEYGRGPTIWICM